VKTTHPKDWHIDGKLASAGDVRLLVFRRDRTCLAYQLNRYHGCVNRWDAPHGQGDWSQLTLEHVPSVHGPEDVRRNDPEHCVTLCWGSNVGVPSKELRTFCREKLREKYPECKG
jgi:hypothetical protein